MSAGRLGFAWGPRAEGCAAMLDLKSLEARESLTAGARRIVEAEPVLRFAFDRLRDPRNRYKVEEVARKPVPFRDGSRRGSRAWSRVTASRVA